jgi:hypothetical protein
MYSSFWFRCDAGGLFGKFAVRKRGFSLCAFQALRTIIFRHGALPADKESLSYLSNHV